MSEQQAELIARATRGVTWQSGGGIWLVINHRADGRCVVHSGDAVCEYRSADAFEDGEPPMTTIEVSSAVS